MFTFNTIIQNQHIDAFGHMNNAAYLEILEEARWDILKTHGFDKDKVNEIGFGPIILEINIRFLKELKLHDAIQIKTTRSSFTGKIGKIFQEIKKNDELCCKAEFTIAFFDLTKRKIIEPNHDILQLFGFLIA